MINVGIVGLGPVNGLPHLRTHLKLGRSNITVLCDRNPQRLAEAAKLAPRARTTTTDDIYTDPNVQAISINTGDCFHVEPFVKALRAGKHVFVEKPVGNSVEQITEMYRAWREADRSLVAAVGYVLRWTPVFEAVHEWCRSGQLGTVYYLEADYIHNLFNQREQTDKITGRNWYLEEEQPMVGGGSHALDLLRWLSGREVVEVSAYATHRAFPDMTNEDCQVALYHFDDGAIAKVAALYGPIAPYAEANNLRVYGTEGTVDRGQLAIRHRPDEVEPEYKPVCNQKFTGRHPYDGEILDWLHAIEGKHEPRVPFWDGANSTIASLYAVKALREGKPQRVPHITPQREYSL